MRLFPYHPHLKDRESEAQEEHAAGPGHASSHSWNGAVRVGRMQAAGLCLNKEGWRGKVCSVCSSWALDSKPFPPNSAYSTVGHSWTSDSFLVCLTLANIEMNLHPREWGGVVGIGSLGICWGKEGRSWPEPTMCWVQPRADGTQRHLPL